MPSKKYPAYRKSFTFYVLIAMTFFSLVFSFFTLVMTFIIPGAFMLFDGGSSPTIWILFLSFITTPLVCLISLVLAWRCYKTERYTVACYVSLIPWVNILLFVCTELYRIHHKI